jgi:RNA polymerase-associated protein RTF1
MEESESESEVPQNRSRSVDNEENQYPVEGLFKSHEEKERIMSMREIEREQILAERREENERIRQNRMLRQLKVNQEKDSKKRKASAAELEDASRKPARARTKAGESNEKMDTLRRAREERSSRKEQRERDNDRRRQRSPSYRRSRSADDRDSDIEWAGKSRPKSRTPEPREKPPADLRDVERVRVGRSRFAEVCFYPGFEQAITGCFVRINIGPDPTTRQEVYRMAIIKGELLYTGTRQVISNFYPRLFPGPALCSAGSLRTPHGSGPLCQGSPWQGSARMAVYQLFRSGFYRGRSPMPMNPSGFSMLTCS